MIVFIWSVFLHCITMDNIVCILQTWFFSQHFWSFLIVCIVHFFNMAMSYTHSKDVHLAIKFEDLYYLKLLVLDSWFIASRTIG